MGGSEDVSVLGDSGGQVSLLIYTVPKSSQRGWLGFGAGEYGMECKPISPCSSSASLRHVGFVNVTFNYTEQMTQGKSDVQFTSC